MFIDSEGFVNVLLIRLGYTLLHFLWQGILIAGISAAGLRLLRAASSDQRYLFLATMFAVMSFTPLLTFSLLESPVSGNSTAFPQASLKSEPSHVRQEKRTSLTIAPIPSSGISTDVSSRADEPRDIRQSTLQDSSNAKPDRVLGFLVVGWAAGVCLLSLRLVVGWYSMMRVRRTGLSAIHNNIQSMCKSLCNSIQVRQTVQVFESAVVQVPVVVGWLKPLILLPTKLVTGLSDEELEAILAHELAHIRRHDYLVNIGQIAVENLLFYHPVVWWLSSRVRQEREHRCDDMAAQFCGSRVKIARALATLAELNARVPVLLPAATGGSVVQRIRRLLQTDAKPERMGCAGIGFGIICLLLPLVVAIGLAVSNSGFNTLNSPQAAALLKSQQMESQRESQRYFTELSRKQNAKLLAAEERETEEQDEQMDLSRNWSLKCPENVQANEFAGLIVDENGKPLAGAKVDLFPAFTGHETTTDQQGMFRYKLEMASRGQTMEVRFSKDGYSPIYRRNQKLDVPNFCVVLDRKTYLEGQIVDEDNNPVPKAKVFAAHPYSWRGEFISFDRETVTLTDENGRYRLYLNPEMYTIAAISEGHGVERVQNVELDKNEVKTLDLQLHAGVHLLARVLDEETAEPIAGLTLYHRTNPLLRGVSNADGLIEISNALPGVEELQVGCGTPAMVRGYFACPTQPFGSWSSPDAKKPWHRTTTTEVAIMFDLSPNMNPITIYVQAGVLISGKVTDPDGHPVAQSTVAPARTGTGNSLTGDTRYSVETKEDGSYIVCLPPSGDAEYNLMAHDGKYSQWRNFASGVTEPFRTKPGQRLENVDIQLHRPATVQGRVTTRDGRSLKGLEVRAHAADKRGNRYYDPTTKTNDDGSFEVSHIRPGKHFIQVEPFQLEAERAPSESSFVIELKEGETKAGVLLELQGKK